MSSLSDAHAALTTEHSRRDDRRATLILFLMVFAGAFALALAVSWQNLVDPFVRHDDFPTVFGEPESYYWKTETEGRWLNYWYISLRLRLATEVSFLMYLSAWSAFAAAFATYAFGPRVEVYPGARLLLAALIVLCPQAFDIAQWFNTVSIGIWVMAIYAVITLFVPRRVAVGLLLVFVPLSFSAYNTYPFYLLALLLCRVDQERSLGDLFRVVAVFSLAFGLAMLVTNLLNWHFHGVFGIVEADWRVPNHVASFADIIENTGIIGRFWQDVLLIYGMGNYLVGYTILVVPLLFALAILRQDRLLALYALTPVAFGMGLLMVYVLKTGIYVPVRATVFFWVVSCFLLVYGVEVLAKTRARKIALGAAMLALVAFFAQEFVKRFGYLQEWQASTREMVRAIPQDSERIVVYGYLAAIPGARNAAIQTFDGLAYRLRYLTGKPVVVCRQVDADCSAESPPFDTRSSFGTTLVETKDRITYIRTPALDLAP